MNQHPEDTSVHDDEIAQGKRGRLDGRIAIEVAFQLLPRLETPLDSRILCEPGFQQSTLGSSAASDRTCTCNEAPKRPAEVPPDCQPTVGNVVAGACNQRYLQLWSGAA